MPSCLPTAARIPPWLLKGQSRLDNGPTRVWSLAPGKTLASRIGVLDIGVCESAPQESAIVQPDRISAPMTAPDSTISNRQSRRTFLKTTSTALAATAVAGALPRPGYAAENNTIKLALIGCGSRGTGAAANALSTRGPTQLWAMADAFAHRLASSLQTLSRQFGQQVQVPPERQFVGLDGFKKAMDCLGPGDVVLLATPPAFRPIHLDYAVDKGLHVFMEKSFAVDAPGIRRVLRAGQRAQQKNLKIATGLMWRHDPARAEAIQRIHDGAIGELILLRTYRMHGPVGYTPRQPGQTELAHQIANYNCFTWLNGGFFVDWLIHNIDICCWAKNALPVAAQGMGGRCARTEPDQLFDHYLVEYVFADGARLFAQGRHVRNCWDIFSDFVSGTRGSGVLMENLARANPRLYKSQVQTPENELWRYRGPTPDPYQVEMDLLFDAIRNDKPYNEVERSALACMTAILGRMAIESGQWLTWDQAFNSNLELAPGLESLTLESEPPESARPDAQGRYPLAVPGRTKAL
jgi:predicted dehydrogenase